MKKGSIVVNKKNRIGVIQKVRKDEALVIWYKVSPLNDIEIYHLNGVNLNKAKGFELDSIGTVKLKNIKKIGRR